METFLEELDSCLYLWEAVEVCQRYKTELNLSWSVYDETDLFLNLNGEEYHLTF